MAEPDRAQSVIDNPIAAALSRVRGARVVAVACALLLLSGLIAQYRVGDETSVGATARRQAFRIGARPYESSEPAPGEGAGSLPSRDLLLPPTDALPAGLAPGSVRTAATSGASGPSGAASTTAVAPAGPLAAGTYAFAVSGSETATGFGTRRFPERAVVTARAAGGDRARLDLDLSSQHQEHFVLAYGDEAVRLVSEGSTMTFGPVTQASEFDVAPALVEVPIPLRPQTQRGTATVRGRDGAPSREEDWTTSVVNEETLLVGAERVAVWVVKVERTSRPGAPEVSNRTSTFWYDPARRMWVKWRERLHTERKSLGVPSTYDLEYEASFAGFRPA